MSGSSDWVVAIDFGTAFSKAAAVPLQLPASEALKRARPLRVGDVANAVDPHLVPSALFLQNQNIYFGPDAIALVQRTSVGKREALQSFKLLLGTNDLTTFLETRPSRRIDPEGAFTYRELITLYLAYFLGLVEQAFRGDPNIGAGAITSWRYTRPGWFTERTARDHAVTVDLFSHAAGLLSALPPMFWRQPLSHDEVKRAFARASRGSIRVEAGVFEASAAATAYLPDVAASAWSIIVIDMGAGTTDFGSYMSVPSLSGRPKMHSLDHTIAIAGDDIDRSLLNVILQKAKGIRSRRELGGLWRHLLPSIRARKEEIFTSGGLTVEFFGHQVTCTRRELEASKDFRAIVNSISKYFSMVVAKTATLAAKNKLRETVVITTGGGARLPFISDMVKKAAAKRSSVRLRVAPARPLWIESVEFGDEIGPNFNQLAIAIGGAMAPKEMLIGARTDA